MGWIETFRVRVRVGGGVGVRVRVGAGVRARSLPSALSEGISPISP